MNLPPFMYSLAFWQALCYVVAAVVAYFTPYKLEAGILLVLILAVLNIFNIAPQIMARRTKLLQRAIKSQDQGKPSAFTGTTTVKYFSFEHLPIELQEVSKPIAELALLMEKILPNGPEKSAGMRKLLEAKDCFVRTKVK